MWYGAAATKSKLNKIEKAEKLSIMKEILDGVRQPPVHDKWTDADEAELELPFSQLRQRLGQLPVDGLLADASYDDGNLVQCSSPVARSRTTALLRFR